MRILNVVIFVTIMFSCQKSEKNMEVIKDCTGSYLRDNGKDYKVCNIEMLENYESGQDVTVAYAHLSSCEALDTVIVCELYHPYEGWIKIKEIE